ncbi:MAG: twin-arginine translocase TatA/TatE family subunit [Candidatus Nitrosocaldaceae archaeon]|nr:MAG: twin-arginine translocase TatA/TatE family subunit [Candidatus Nitrosocaldaceae archaeon]
MDSIYLFVAGMEWVWILVILGIILFGAKKIPELARSMGKATAEYERARIEAERELRDYKGSRPDREKLEEIAKSLGIDYIDKSDDELREAIEKVINKKK